MKHRLGKYVMAAFAHGGLLFLVYHTALAPLITEDQASVSPLFFGLVHVLLSLSYFSLLVLWLYAYDYHYFLNFGREIILRSLLVVVIFTLIAVTIILVLNGLFIFGAASPPFAPIERYVTIIFLIVIIDAAAFLGLYFLQFLWICHLIRLGYLQKNLLVVGDPDERFPVSWLEEGDATKSYQGRLFRNNKEWLFHKHQNGVISVSEARVRDLLFKWKIGEVIIFLCESLTEKDVSLLVKVLRENSINYYLVPDISKLSRGAVADGSFPYVPVIGKYTTKRDSVTHITLKRLFDVLFVTLSLFVTLPLGLIVALLIKLDDSGPVFYTHRRVGKNGRIIKFLKFRSMVRNADLLKRSLERFNQRGDGPLFKMKNDPRITRVGRVLRKFSLDELPQLVNVLKGDLSLVGPRPHLVEEVAGYAERDMLRLECIPGITCLPQVLGRDTVDFREWIELDLTYRKKWSNSLDLKILVRSLNEVVSPLFKRF
ncbi:MAG TPA: exopolysaccharide biosynthesis polyprenyl glycosylphosphotransferase [Spirochaetia bacterium]|nr:exopolysaccharide biosynthesis polyprenyl glycosylphosphotransferase [Spirochaetia bacterium]